MSRAKDKAQQYHDHILVLKRSFWDEKRSDGRQVCKLGRVTVIWIKSNDGNWDSSSGDREMNRSEKSMKIQLKN